MIESTIKTKKTQGVNLESLYNWWPLCESNTAPTDYESAAPLSPCQLPTITYQSYFITSNLIHFGKLNGKSQFFRARIITPYIFVTRVLRMRHNLYPTPQHHVIVRQAVYTTDSSVFMPVIYLKQADGSVKRFELLIEYFKKYPFQSLDWMQICSRALGLLWDYLIAQKSSFDWITNQSHRKIIKDFTLAIVNGTYRAVEQDDPLHLFWSKTSRKQARKLMSALVQFILWCAEDRDIKTDLTITAKITITPDSFTSFMYVAEFIKKVSFLSHIKNTKNIATNLIQKSQRAPVNLGPDKHIFEFDRVADAFPEEYLDPFIRQGFIKNPEAELLHEKFDLNGLMFALLMFFGGLRRSEPHHLWYNDISPIGKQLIVLLSHPELARTRIIGAEEMTRSEYLGLYGLSSRNLANGNKSYYVGWKDLKMDRNFTAPVYWINQHGEDMFKELYVYYLSYRESLIRSNKHQTGINHPFLFVANGIDQNSGDDFRGLPYSYAAFEKSWGRALIRTSKYVGEKLDNSKISGFTPHGARHYYGKALKEFGIDRKVIQECMHHKSIFSQEVYTKVSHKKIFNELEELRRKPSSNSFLNMI